MRFRMVNEAVQELTLPKREILQNIDFFLQKLKFSESLQNEECVICMENFDTENIPVKINCNCSSNYYHKSCLYNWFDKNCSCPVCRKNLRTPDIEI